MSDTNKEATPQSQSSAEQIFNQFSDSNDFREILQLFYSLCSQVQVDPNHYEGFYSSLKSSLKSWRATSLFDLLDARASLPEYDGQRSCAGKRVLVVGAGPVGLRGAIELALLGAKVDLVEKRPDFQRNNSLHLWPFLITDLRNLGAKKFYGKFASGAIDHICIRILQAILLKICLLLGVKVHVGVTFKGIIEPKDTKSGWRAETTPTTTPISSYDFDVILAADGKQNSLPGFRSKEFRAKLALAITVNYVNHNTQQENSVPEIGGVAYLYRQDFFNNLVKAHGIELENIVYYKDETHYFVMCVKKQSLLLKGVLKKDHNDPKQLLASTNIDHKNLEIFALEATTFATDGALGSVEFEKNHKGENDVALFDFTSLFASENAARIIERRGKRLLMCLAGDSLIEPFWPTGSGCARGFLGAFDNAWMIKRFCTETATPMELIEEREAILYLLPQTTPHRLSSNLSKYTIDPKSRYPNLSELVPPGDVSHLYDTDNQNAVVKTRSTVPATSQDKPKAAIEQQTVEPTVKRSKSSEALHTEAHSAKIPSTSSEQSKESPEPSATDVKHFWQKRQNVKTDTKLTSKQESQKKPSGEKEVVKNTNSAKPPPSPSLKKTSKYESPIRDPPQAKPSPQTGKESSTKYKQKEKPSKTTSSKPPHHEASPKVKRDSKSPHRESSPKAKKDSKAADSPKAKHEKSQKQASPKWSRFSLGSKSRSRSESPERVAGSKKDKDPKPLQQHPLQVTRSLQSLDKEPEEETTQVNVLDIVKKYDDRAESLAQSQTEGKKEKQSTAQKSGGDHQAKGASKKQTLPNQKSLKSPRKIGNLQKKLKVDFSLSSGAASPMMSPATQPRTRRNQRRQASKLLMSSH